MAKKIRALIQSFIKSSFQLCFCSFSQRLAFGDPHYGSSIQNNVYYADSDLCDSNVDTSRGYPLRPMRKTSNGQVLMEPWPAPFILMVDRGHCTFVRKVRNAQRTGASGVLIADTSCLCDRGAECTPDHPGDVCTKKEPIMADDGSARDISIPSFLLEKQDADSIKAVLKENQTVLAEMAWPVQNPDDRVEYDLWTSPTDKVSREFLSHFKKAALALGFHAYFTPHMFIYNGITTKCYRPESETNQTNMCSTLCTNGGRYCATDPDNDLSRGISGADVVTESLRRECIWNIYGRANGIGAPWWDYVEEFMLHCDTKDHFSDMDCVENAMNKTQISPEEVEQCMNDSGGLESGSNTILDELIRGKESSGVIIIPSIYINRSPIRGALAFDNVFDAICAGFAKGFAPLICNACVNALDKSQCVSKNSLTSSPTPMPKPENATTVPTLPSTPEPSSPTNVSAPVIAPITVPVVAPVRVRTVAPFFVPHAVPVAVPITVPHVSPTRAPTQAPIFIPLIPPVVPPIAIPHVPPTRAPVQYVPPTRPPTRPPSPIPTRAPTQEPTRSPGFSPSTSPATMGLVIAILFVCGLFGYRYISRQRAQRQARYIGVYGGDIQLNDMKSTAINYQPI